MFTRHQTSHIRVTTTAISLLLAVGTVVATSSPGHAARPKPSGLQQVSSGSVVAVKWNPVKGAIDYDVQMSASSTFDQPFLNDDTTNTTATPTTGVPNGRIYWRVRAVFASGESGWAVTSFSRSPSAAPVALAPANGALLSQPMNPPVLQWQAVASAESYLVEVDNVETVNDQPDWVGSTIIQTETTSTVVNEPQPNGVYYWRVRAELDADQFSVASSARSYSIGALPQVQIAGPAQQSAPVEQVVLEWPPVPGAVSYDVRVSTDNGFNKIVDQKTVTGTRYSPLKTYDNASYWWQVRAVNALGQSEEWPLYPERTGEFRRVWQQSAGSAEALKPQLTHPLDAASASGAAGDDLYFRWQAARLASHYVLDLSRDPGFPNTSTFRTQSCVTTQTTYASRRGSTRVECTPNAAGTWYWRVRALDSQSSTNGSVGVNSGFSEVRSFTWTPPSAPSGSGTGQAPGTRLLLDGGASSCDRTLPDSISSPVGDNNVCAGVPATPTFDWDPVPGAAYYRLYLARDREFTNMVDGYGDAGDPTSLPASQSTMWTPTSALPDTQAGEAYYWYVRACNAEGSCGANPAVASNAFQKKSPAVQMTLLDQVADQVTFSWTDYRSTNAGTGYFASNTSPVDHPGQSAMAYRLEVSDTGTFARGDIIDTRVVDQTTYTAFDTSYPEGPLWWRVQAIDGSGNGLTWSDIDPFTKRSAAPTPISPVNGTLVAGVAPFRWEPRTYSKYYDLEVYRNNDRTASPANLAASARNVRQTAYSFSKPLQALGQDFVWRVRRTDSDGNKGPWSTWQSFRVDATVPQLSAPASSATVSKRGAVFVWKVIPTATSYRVEWSNGGRTTGVQTPLTAFATRSTLARGASKWRVFSYDSQGDPMRVSAWRAFRVR